MIREYSRLFCISLLIPAFPICVIAQPQFPPGYDPGDNSVRGGAMGEEVTLELTAHHAGELLYESDLFTVHERINYLSDNTDSYGDPVCYITNPGAEYQYFSSRLVVVMDMARDETITRRLLWDEVRPVLTELTREVCPQASRAIGHIYIRGWDMAGNGQPYRTEAFKLPLVQLAPWTEDDVTIGTNTRNVRAFDTIRGVVSEGMLVATFAYDGGETPACGDDGQTGINCTYDTFAPEYGGAPVQNQLYLLNSRLRLARSNQERAVLREQIETVTSDYEQYGSFDRYVEGTAYRIQRNEYARQRNAQRQALMNSFYETLSRGMEVVDEYGWGPALMNTFMGGTPEGGVCGRRPNAFLDRCTEDFTFIVN